MAVADTDSLSLSKLLSEKYNGCTFRKYLQNQLLTKSDDILLAWSKQDGCIFAQLNDPPDSNVQTLALSKPPLWEVEKILLSHNQSCLALIGRRGVAVVELPKRHGDPCLYDGGRDVITCRVEYIAERFFSCHPKLEVVSASWHPGSLEYNYIVTLASDNYLRIYTLSSPEIPEQAILVAPNANVLNASFARSATLGESAVDFGFALPSEQLKRFSGNPVSGRLRDEIDPDEELKQKYLALQWPIFILYGNGDIYYTNTVLGRDRPPFHNVYGPLTITPQCEDNYGVDSCSLLVLQSSPPVLIIATSVGQLNHCIVIDNGEDDDENTDSRSASHNGSLLGIKASVRLHVYERVELELSLLPDDEGFTCPLLLHADPTSPTRYWVSHEAGVHGVTFPLVEHLISHMELAEDAMFMSNESQCIVDHAICTRSITSAGPMPVIGFVMSGSNTLYVLLASGSIISCVHPPALVPHIPDTGPSHFTNSMSPLRKVHTESFEDHIRTILHRSSSQPILASGSSKAVTPNEYSNLISRVVENLRSNYLQPQITAKQDIMKRSEILKEQKMRLQSEINNLENSKKELTEKAHELAERYEETNEKKAQLISRYERILTQIMRGVPGLSTAEKNMLQELEGMQKHTPTLSSQLSQMEEKAKWQTSQMEKLQSAEASKLHQTSALSDSQVKALIQALGKEGEKLSVLVERMTDVKQDIQLR